MATKEAHSRATVRYQQRHLRRYTFTVNKDKRPEVIEWLATKDNVNGYMMGLVMADMAANGAGLPDKHDDD